MEAIFDHYKAGFGSKYHHQIPEVKKYFTPLESFFFSIDLAFSRFGSNIGCTYLVFQVVVVSFLEKSQKVILRWKNPNILIKTTFFGPRFEAKFEKKKKKKSALKISSILVTIAIFPKWSYSDIRFEIVTENYFF